MANDLSAQRNAALNELNVSRALLQKSMVAANAVQQRRELWERYNAARALYRELDVKVRRRR